LQKEKIIITIIIVKCQVAVSMHAWPSTDPDASFHQSPLDGPTTRFLWPH
jgi:hypothetical protein